eukprot:282704-Rhodomonas_salina.1
MSRTRALNAMQCICTHRICARVCKHAHVQIVLGLRREQQDTPLVRVEVGHGGVVQRFELHALPPPRVLRVVHRIVQNLSVRRGARLVPRPASVSIY